MQIPGKDTVAAANVERGPTVAGAEELAGQLLLFEAETAVAAP
ncbi:hypothetical protein QF032_006437 [Streptomyces achromogenes]|nr:hypothetical protein [Streptomyces achromogenes]MDQ0834593.1 hypothetical protein [Streptomyces achromogenes]